MHGVQGLGPRGGSATPSSVGRSRLAGAAALQLSSAQRPWAAGYERSKLIDGLLDRPEFAKFWALKWGDILRMTSKQVEEYLERLTPRRDR